MQGVSFTLHTHRSVWGITARDCKSKHMFERRRTGVSVSRHYSCYKLGMHRNENSGCTGPKTETAFYYLIQ